NALVGDLLHARGSDLAIAMAVRHAGDDVVCDRESLGIAFPAATGRLAVFVHGLAENDDWWRPVPDAAGEHPRPCFGDRLEAELGYTSVYIRYNTGLHVSENGERLCRLLDALVTAWPVPVESLALIGHSMGGLVARSACHAASSRATDWAGRTRHVVCLGTP